MRAARAGAAPTPRTGRIGSPRTENLMNPEASSRIVCKFGGSSLASAAQFRKVRALSLIHI